ncbi:hypothetical protein BXY82_2961 [Gelidibacter sediminis]|uniref:Uncharacterized protein n=1 Tax=Gelidibacter sediminis TaxID=1608710 RepID=A0A4V6Q4G0_9FLAO|nr:hypothetical protein BXY82_2961 [Gelidibacter sediminis]
MCYRHFSHLGLPPETTGDWGILGVSAVHETNTIKLSIDIGNLSRFTMINTILIT